LHNKLKIGLLGTRGIPNHYGGFEQWAEQLSQGLVERGCSIVVYNSHFHPYKKPEYNGVELIRKWDPKRIGLASQFVYDFLCILDARRRKFDTIIQLGYTTSSVWAWLLPRNTRIIYNMDGMEWKREKYKGLLKSFLKYAEKLAVNHSDIVIADSKTIKEYLDNKYGINAEFIPYPASVINKPKTSVLEKYNLKVKLYLLLIARFQPDNNFEMIIEGVINSKLDFPLVIVGDHLNKYGRYLIEKYGDKRIVFLGKIYDKEVLDSLRYYSTLYFHGHSAGGTNPSLLEAMAASCTICAHNNEYNKAVTGKDAFYFKSESEISGLLNGQKDWSSKETWITNNIAKLQHEYKLSLLVEKYFNLLKQ